MTPREIIAEAWSITKKQRSLRHWGFVGSLFETLRNVELLLYQAYYMYWFSKGLTKGWFSVEELFFKNLPFWAFITVTAIIVILLILELFMPTFSTGPIIGLAAKAHRKEEVKGGLVLALYNFFPLLEIHGMFVLAHFTTAIVVGSMIVRYGNDAGVTATALVFLIFIWLVAMLFQFFSSFAEEGVVIRKTGIFIAIGRSFKLIISYLSHIMFLLILLFVISIRIFLNAIMILLIPAIAIGIGFLLATFLSPALSYTIAAIIGLLMLLPVSYFLAYLHVFKQTVWTLTYMELSGRKDLDEFDA